MQTNPIITFNKRYRAHDKGTVSGKVKYSIICVEFFFNKGIVVLVLQCASHFYLVC